MTLRTTLRQSCWSRTSGEQCAIGVYKRLLEITKDKDPVTYNIVLQILQQEVEHEEDLQALLETSS